MVRYLLNDTDVHPGRFLPAVVTDKVVALLRRSKRSQRSNHMCSNHGRLENSTNGGSLADS
jgi:hypothetical protein